MIASLTPRIRGLILDMDGVLWKDTQAIGDLPKIFERIREQGIKVVLVTNNATKEISEYLKKFGDFGVTLKAEQIITSAHGVVELLKERFPNGGKVFIVGEDSLKRVLALDGFIHSEDRPLAVVAGMDRGINYEKLSMACLLVRSGLPFIGTNPDTSFPTPQGLIPGAGAIITALEVSTDQKAIIAGKPSPLLYEVALHRLGTTLDETLAVGDRFETDIVGGQVFGCKTALVLSGVSTIEQSEQWKPRPDLVVQNLTELIG